MIAPVARLSKAEIVWLGNNRCRHGHSYLEHYPCYLKDNPNKFRIGYIDIEASNLRATFGLMYCYCIKERGSKKIYERVITKEEITNPNVMDREVVRQCIADMDMFDITCGFYSGAWRYDIPFIRTRSLYHRLPFFSYGSKKHRDIYPIAKKNLCMHSYRLKEVAKICLGKTRKTELDPKHWIMAMGGNAKSLGYIIKHCRYDVMDLEDVHKVLEPFHASSCPSI